MLLSSADISLKVRTPHEDARNRCPARSRQRMGCDRKPDAGCRGRQPRRRARGAVDRRLGRQRRADFRRAQFRRHRHRPHRRRDGGPRHPAARAYGHGASRRHARRPTADACGRRPRLRAGHLRHEGRQRHGLRCARASARAGQSPSPAGDRDDDPRRGSRQPLFTRTHRA